MFDYIVRGLSGTVPCGSIVVLNAEQVRRRFHNLRPADGENTYITTNAIMFKRGEEFSCNLDLTKQQLGAIKLVGGGPDESEITAVEQETEAAAEATAADLLDRSVHLAGIVGKYPQPGSFIGQVGSILGRVSLCHAEQDHQPLINGTDSLTANNYRGLNDPLNDRSHTLAPCASSLSRARLT